MDALEAIFARRSIARLTDPGPSDDDLTTILRAAAAAPDHGELRPWKFVILRGEGLAAFGHVLADAYLRRCRRAGAEPIPAKLAKERTKLNRAPLVVVVCAVHRHNDLFPWEDQLGAGFAAAENALLAATALGYGSMWRTGDAAWDNHVKAAVGISEHDAIVGFLYLGTPYEGGWKESHDPDLDGLVEEWRPPSPAL